MNKIARTLVLIAAFLVAEKTAEHLELARIDANWTEPASSRNIARRVLSRGPASLFADMVDFIGARRTLGGFHLGREHTGLGVVVVVTCKAHNGASVGLAAEIVRALRNDGFTAEQDGFAVRIEWA